MDFRWSWRRCHTRFHAEPGSQALQRRWYCGGYPWESRSPPEILSYRNRRPSVISDGLRRVWTLWKNPEGSRMNPAREHCSGDKNVTLHRNKSAGRSIVCDRDGHGRRMHKDHRSGDEPDRNAVSSWRSQDIRGRDMIYSSSRVVERKQISFFREKELRWKR